MPKCVHLPYLIHVSLMTKTYGLLQLIIICAFFKIVLFSLLAVLQLIQFYSFIIFSILINAVIFLLNCLVLILYLYIHFLYLRSYVIYLNIIGPLYNWHCSESIPVFVLFHYFYISWCCKLFLRVVGYGHLCCYFFIFNLQYFMLQLP